MASYFPSSIEAHSLRNLVLTIVFIPHLCFSLPVMPNIGSANAVDNGRQGRSDTVWTRCMAQLVVEDYFESASTKGYVLCHQESGTSAIVIPVNPDYAENSGLFHSGDLIEVAKGADVPLDQTAIDYELIRFTANGAHPFVGVASEGITVLEGDLVLRKTKSEDPTSEVAGRERKQTLSNEGDRSLLILRVVYNGIEPDYCDEECARENVRKLDTIYQEMSNGQLRFPEARSSVITVRVNGGNDAGGCNYWGIGLEAIVEAERSGTQTSQYQHKAFMIPRDFGSTNCNFAGLGFVGCTYPTCRVWLRNEQVGTLAHEVGHNLGLRHSALDADNDGIQDSEYGDNSDLMGFQKYVRGINAPHLEKFGWVTVKSVEPSSSCTYETETQHQITSLYAPSNTFNTQNPRVLKLPRVSKVSSSPGFYYISFRAATGLDEEFDDPSDFKKIEYKDKVFIHYMLASTTSAVNTQLVTALGAGEEFSDNDSDFHIKVTSVDVKNDATSRATISLTGCKGIAQPQPRIAVSTTATVPCSKSDPLSYFDTSSGGDLNTRVSTFYGSVTTKDSIETCASSCVNDSNCVAFTFSGQSNKCWLSTGTGTGSRAESKLMISLVKLDVCLQPQCVPLLPFQVKPKCGNSADGAECCAGSVCKGKLNNKGVRIFRCEADVEKRTSTVGRPCTKNIHCETGLKCDRNNWVCAAK